MTLRGDSGNRPLTVAGQPPADETDPLAGPDPPADQLTPPDWPALAERPDPADLATAAATPASTPADPAGPPRSRTSVLLLGGAVAVCLAALAGLAVILLPGVSTGHTRPAPLPPVFRLRAGDCINSPPNAVAAPQVLPCGQPHDGEIYATFSVAGHRWPGTAAIGGQARQGCAARLSGYLNPQLATAVLAESYIYPDQGAWDAGERTVVCEIRSTAGKLTGSVRGLR
jgi:Septum formation